MRFFDCTTFFCEFELLKLRCEELKALNPIHVLVEAAHTHTGYPKPFNFEARKHEFSQYNIRYIKVLEFPPNGGDPWKNENFQRDAIMQGLYDASDDDIVYIGDLDEIPRKEAISYYDPRMGIAGLNMDKYSCYLNLLEGIQIWNVPRLCTYGILKETTPNKLRNAGPNFIINYAGWHMSFMGGLDKMREKLFAYAHTESLNSNLLDNLEYKYEHGQSLWGDDFWKFVKINSTFPKYLQENQHEFKHLLSDGTLLSKP